MMAGDADDEPVCSAYPVVFVGLDSRQKAYAAHDPTFGSLMLHRLSVMDMLVFVTRAAGINAKNAH
jgi:hypothetical protein